MQTKAIHAVLIIAVMLSQGILVHAQGTQSNGEKIRLLREEIKQRETIDVPDDLKDLNRSKLMERRAELRTLLRVEVNNLQKYQAQLGALATADESQKIANSVQGYEAEIKGLGDAMLKDLASESAAHPTPSPSSQPMTDVSPERTVTTTEIANTGTTTTEGAPSNSNADSSPPPQQPENVPLTTASEENSSGGATLDCQEVRNPSNQKFFSELDKIICGLANDIPKRRIKDKLPQNRLILNSPQFFNLIKILIAKRDTPAFLVEAEETRMDKQIGGGPSGGGSTSLVVKGGAPAILGFAVENGALTQSVDKTAVTFRGNPVGLFNALSNNGFVPSVKEDERDPILRLLKKTSFAFTFNTDRGTEPGVFTGTKQQLASFSSRTEFINNRKPELYIKDWEDFLMNNAQPLADLLNNSNDQFIDPEKDSRAFPFGVWRDPAMQSWYEKTQQALADATDAEVDAVLQERLDKLPVDELSQGIVLLLNGIEKQLGIYVSGRNEVLKKINSGAVVTFEYLNNREVNAPDTSNFRFIAEKGTAGGGIDLTFNGSLTIFNKKPVPTADLLVADPPIIKTGRIRDFQFAGQLDKPFNTDFGQFVLWFSGRYERLMQDVSTQAGTIIPNTSGDIAIGQLGLKIPIKGMGMKFPISITFSNRTELIKEREVRGNFGFTLDLDTLFAKFKPF